MATIQKKNKRLKDEVYKIIRNDIPLRAKLADSLNIERDSVYNAAVRKSPKFSLPFVLDIIIKHTGKTKDEILEA